MFVMEIIVTGLTYIGYAAAAAMALAFFAAVGAGLFIHMFRPALLVEANTAPQKEN